MVSAEELVARLQAQGERLTLQRRLVLEAMCEDEAHHLAVHDIQARLAERGTSLNETTIYRILQWLKSLGLISQTDLGHSGVMYQVIGPEPHHHLVCLNCGAVIDVPDSVFESLRARLRQDYDFAPRIDHMAVFGLCANCAAATRSTADEA